MLIRSTALSLRELDFVHAALALGRRDLALAYRQHPPELSGAVARSGTFIFAYAVLAEAILGFLGVWRPAVCAILGQCDRQRKEHYP